MPIERAAPSRRAVLGLSGAGLLAACAPAAPRGPTEFEGLLDDFGRDYATAFPEQARAAGVTPEEIGRDLSSTLNDRSALAVERARAGVLRRSAQLAGAGRAGLSPGQRRTRSALAAHFAVAQPCAGFAYGRFTPLAEFGPFVADPDLAVAALPAQALFGGAAPDGALARLEALASAIDAERERIAADAGRGVVPSARMLVRLRTRVAAQSLDAYLAPFPASDPLRPAAERAIARRLQPALGRFLAALDGLRAPESVALRTLANGERFAAAGFDFAASMSVDPKAVHGEALERLRAVETQLDMGLRALGRTDGAPMARFAALAAEPEQRFGDGVDEENQLRAARARLIDEIWSRAGQVFAGLDAPPAVPGVPADRLSLTRSLVVALLAEALPERRLAAQGGRPLIRRLLRFPGYEQGWRLYVEALADELGLYDGDPAARLAHLVARRRAAALTVAETGLHAMGWSSAQGEQFLAAEVGEPEAAPLIIDRMLAAPGAASAAEIGRAELMRLRESARSALGARFDIRGFHDIVLRDGATPLATLGGLVAAWAQG